MRNPKSPSLRLPRPAPVRNATRQLSALDPQQPPRRIRAVPLTGPVGLFVVFVRSNDVAISVRCSSGATNTSRPSGSTLIRNNSRVHIYSRNKNPHSYSKSGGLSGKKNSLSICCPIALSQDKLLNHQSSCITFPVRLGLLSSRSLDCPLHNHLPLRVYRPVTCLWHFDTLLHLLI